MSELAMPTRAFVLGLADRSGVIDAAALYDAASAVGFTDTKLRLALRRLGEAGLIESEGRGRAARWWLTDAGLAERADDLSWVAMAHRVDHGLDRWDGDWHLTAFEVPERQRAARDTLRTLLVELFAAPLGGGLYVSPWPLRIWIGATIEALGIADRVTHVATPRIDVGGSAEPATIAARLWPVDELADAYVDFLARWRPVVDDPPTDEAEAVRAAFGASAEIESILRRDPVLPVEMLPASFGGADARALYRRLLSALGEHAVIADANVFGAYESAITQALAESAEEFWGRVTA
ncbi:MAG: PaaX family transcriptional regulator C-terminal domain-containing protein [Actinomycetota bacterium]